MSGQRESYYGARDQIGGGTAGSAIAVRAPAWERYTNRAGLTDWDAFEAAVWEWLQGAYDPSPFDRPHMTTRGELR